MAPAAHLCKSTSAQSKKLTKTNSFKALTVEDSDGNDTDFIDDESGSEESDGDGDISTFLMARYVLLLLDTHFGLTHIHFRWQILFQ